MRAFRKSRHFLSLGIAVLSLLCASPALHGDGSAGIALSLIDGWKKVDKIPETCMSKNSIKNFEMGEDLSVRFSRTDSSLGAGKCGNSPKHVVVINGVIALQSEPEGQEFLTDSFRGEREWVFLMRHRGDDCYMTDILSVQKDGTYVLRKIGNCSKRDRVRWDGERLRVHFPPFRYYWRGKMRSPPFFYVDDGTLPAEEWIYEKQEVRQIHP